MPMNKAALTLVAIAGLSASGCDDDDPSSAVPVPSQPEEGAGAAAGGQPDAGRGPDVRATGSEEPRVVQPLMNGWRFTFDNRLRDEEALADTAAAWQQVSLPHTWNAEDAASPNSLDYRRGVGWYRLEFASPTSGVRHWLEFGAASLVADVWLNGQRLGQHRGGFTQFRFDVTAYVAPARSNVLLVKVDNGVPNGDDDVTAITPLGGDFNKSGGLYRQVALLSTAGAAHFALDDLGGPGVFASTAAVEGGDATLQLRAKLSNDGAEPLDHTLRVALLDADGQVAAESEQPVRLEGSARREVSSELHVVAAHLWQGRRDPYLYQLVFELLDAGKTPVDRVTQRFGIRQMRFDEEHGFFLNDEPMRLNGVAMHQDFQGKGWALSDQDIDTSLALIVEMGANAVRLGHYPFSAYTLERVSELGLVAWAEAPAGLRTTDETCTRFPATEAFVENAKQQTAELIRQQYNYAAVALWSIGNETSAGQIGCDDPFDNVTPVLRSLNDVAKAEDPTRPTVYAEFPHPTDRSGPFATEGITDLFATNRYFLWYHEPIEALSPLLDELRELAQGQPFAVSEYGAGSSIAHHTDDPLGGMPEVHTADDDEPSSAQPEEYASFVHEQNWAVISSKRYLWGSFAWNMFDFGSTNRNEGGVFGINTKGLVTFDRQVRKDPFYFYKAMWSAEPVTYITSRRYTDRAYAVTEVKVYSNADAVELSVNGDVPLVMMREQCPQSTCRFENVALQAGVNTLVATGRHGEKAVTDSVEWSFDDQGVNIAAGFLTSGYVSSTGARFGSDHFFSGGTGSQIESGDAEGGIPDDITGTDDPQLFKYFRVGAFSYVIPLADGTYDVTLGFLEPEEDASPGDRVFSVSANGRTLLDNFDIVETAEEDRVAITETFPVTVTGRRLVLDFEPSEGEALVSNIQIARAQQ
jgi:beta-galactosidase